jgi:hypothetical protein
VCAGAAKLGLKFSKFGKIIENILGYGFGNNTQRPFRRWLGFLLYEMMQEFSLRPVQEAVLICLMLFTLNLWFCLESVRTSG